MKKLTEMTDKMKGIYADLFINALDSMESAAWQKPWVSAGAGVPCNYDRKKKPYKGVNAFLLQMLTQLSGFETPFFMTMTQIKERGLFLNGKLVTDESGLPVFGSNGLPKMQYEKWFPVYWFKPYFYDKDGNRVSDEDVKAMTAEEKNELTTRFYLKDYEVWNIDQTNFKEKYPEQYAEMTEVKGHEYKHGTKDAVLEKMIMDGGWRCPILFGGHSSHYNPSEDHIRLPERKKFLSDAMFYGVAIHEMAHSTAKELKRSQDGTFGSAEYAMEEFVAELTSACVCSMLGVGKLLDEQHLAYVDNWRKAIREQGDFVPKVIDQVQKATNYILRQYEKVRKENELPQALPMAA